MINRLRQRGDSKAGCLLWILGILFMALVGFRVVPIQTAKLQLKDHMEDLAQRQPRWSADRFRSDIHRRANELKLPIKKKDIKIRKSDTRVVIDVDFKVPLDFVVTTYVWEVSIHVDRDIFLM